ncbi:MAG: apolipoprotein N-acyltransferase [Phycisphaerae bacterium]|nr:apolipoprotein N-acyltransferase [Phycisphaerae bacterium]
MRGPRNQMIVPLLGLGATALLLTLIHPPVGWAALAWVAYTPFVLGCAPALRTRTLGLAAFGVGVVYWMVSLNWIRPVTLVGWVAFCPYMALLWPLMALALQFCRRRRVPLVLATAVVVVGAERLQGFPLGGFFWRFLAHSQFGHPALIQLADLFGAAGVSFVLALVSGLAADLVLAARSKGLLRTANLAKAVCVGAAVVAAIAYGQWRLAQTEAVTSPGPLVGSLQSNVPQSVKRTFQSSDDLFAELLEMSRSAAQAGADLIVWPETSVQAIMDEGIWPLLSTESLGREFDRSLRTHALQDRASVLIGAYGGRVRRDDQGDLVLDRFNSAYLYRPDGTQDPQRYDKIHLVLFGEYLPFKSSFRWLYNLLMRCTPYNYDYTLEPGSQDTVFAMDPNHAAPAAVPYRFGVLICYEDTVPWLARRFTLDERGRKRIDGLVNISNDGWFVRFAGDPVRVRPSAELAQHVAVCVFRAVENRTPILRSVNTGISCRIDSCGRIQDAPLASSSGLPVKAMDRTGMAGWFVDRMPIDRRISLYSRTGPWLDNLCAVTLAVGVAWAIRRRLFLGRGSGRSGGSKRP